MPADSPVDDTDESHTASHLRTDGGEAEAADDQDSTDESSEDQQETADESGDQNQTADEPATIDADDEAVAEQTGDVGVEPQPDEATEDESEEREESAPSLDGEGDTAGIIEVRNQVIELSTDVIGRGLDGIIEVTRNDDSWRAVVEIIERRSVPDTQDILGQYEIELDEEGEVIGYRRLEKYRRSDTGPSEY